MLRAVFAAFSHSGFGDTCKEITLIADAEIYILTAAVVLSQPAPATVGGNRGRVATIQED
jgi:hypothetical protein